MKSILATVAALAVVGLAGCADDVTSSENIPTESIEVRLDVAQWAPHSISVEAQVKQAVPLYEGDELQYLELKGGDRLIASIGEPLADVGDAGGNLFDAIGQLTAVHHQMSGGNTSSTSDWWLNDDLVQPYRTAFSGVADGQSIYVSFYRPQHTDAINSYATAPAAFAIATPAPNQEFSRGADAIVITWTPVDATVSAVVKGETRCTNGQFSSWTSTPAADTGTATIPANTFSGSGVCALTIIVDRYTNGVVDPNFHHGQFLVHQKRRVVVSTNP